MCQLTSLTLAKPKTKPTTMYIVVALVVLQIRDLPAPTQTLIAVILLFILHLLSTIPSTTLQMLPTIQLVVIHLTPQPPLQHPPVYLPLLHLLAVMEI